MEDVNKKIKDLKKFIKDKTDQGTANYVGKEIREICGLVESESRKGGDVIDEWIPFNQENYNLYAKLVMENNCLIKYDNGDIQKYQDKEQPFATITHFKTIK
jgi:hypothetical protein